MTKNNLKVVKSTKDQELDNKEKNKALDAAISQITDNFGIENLDPILEKVEINDVWGVGRQLTKFYQKNGIYNARQLKNKSNTWIKKCSNVLSSRTAMELRGIPCISLETTQTKRKS